MSDFDNELSRTLHRRADDLSAVPLAFDDVRGRATSIRRRRQLATGLGALAAVAVIVPTAMFAAKNINADSELQPGTDVTPTVVDSNGTDGTDGPAPTQGTDAGALDVLDLPTGAPPAVVLVDDGSFATARTADATVRWTKKGVVVEAGGQSFGPYPGSMGLARNLDGTAVAWATDDGDVMVWSDGSDVPYTISTDFGQTSVRVVAVTGTDCQQGAASDCQYFVSRYNMETDKPESVRISGDGSVETVDPDRLIIAITDASEDGRVLGLTEISDGGSCSVMLDPARTGSTPVFKTCNHTLDAFSPNGGFVLASEPYHSGIGSGTVAVYDAQSGELLAERTRREDGNAFYNSAVWEDETHVLFSAYQDGQWSIVRMGVDGSMEYAVTPQDGNAERVPWHFGMT